MKYAIIKTGGKQYRVQEGDEIAVEKLGLEANTKHTFSDILLYVDGDKREFGSPVVSGVTVSATILGDKKTRKVRVAKFKAKAKYRRVTGHRSVMTHIKIEAIGKGK